VGPLVLFVPVAGRWSLVAEAWLVACRDAGRQAAPVVLGLLLRWVALLDCRRLVMPLAMTSGPLRVPDRRALGRSGGTGARVRNRACAGGTALGCGTGRVRAGRRLGRGNGVSGRTVDLWVLAVHIYRECRASPPARPAKCEIRPVHRTNPARRLTHRHGCVKRSAPSRPPPHAARPALGWLSPVPVPGRTCATRSLPIAWRGGGSHSSATTAHGSQANCGRCLTADDSTRYLADAESTTSARRTTTSARTTNAPEGDQSLRPA
jgi:hypothetical protein